MSQTDLVQKVKSVKNTSVNEEAQSRTSNPDPTLFVSVQSPEDAKTKQKKILDTSEFNEGSENYDKFGNFEKFEIAQPHIAKTLQKKKVKWRIFK